MPTDNGFQENLAQEQSTPVSINSFDAKVVIHCSKLFHKFITLSVIFKVGPFLMFFFIFLAFPASE